MKSWDLLKPTVDGLSRLDTQMVPLWLHIQSLNSDVSLDNTTIVRSIEPVVGLSILRIKTRNWCVDFQLDYRNWSSGNGVDIWEIGLGRQYLVQIVESSLQSKVFRNMLKVFENLIFDSNIDIAVLNGDSTGAASKKFYLNIVKAEQKLNSFIGDKSSFMIGVCLFWYFISKILQFFRYYRRAYFLQILRAHWEFLYQFQLCILWCCRKLAL